ncbi:hypothetical protein, partial [uncultured Thalassospira sp.]|uniref:hypothetical protein n=1 Tax=uncultured Thalassospira sp. TaxID=404382 RepID=UPI0030DBA651
LRGLTRSFVMTGEVRLVGEGALNLPGAAAMAAGAAVGCDPSMVDQWGPVRPKCVRAPSVAGSAAIAESGRSRQ